MAVECWGNLKYYVLPSLQLVFLSEKICKNIIIEKKARICKQFTQSKTVTLIKVNTFHSLKLNCSSTE